jgi:signal transduction histidine kinase
MEIRNLALALKESNSQFNLTHYQLSQKSKALLLAYRCAIIIISAVCIFFFIPAGFFRINPYLLCGIALLDTCFVSGLPFVFHPLKSSFFSIIMIAADMAVCVFLIIFSGAVGSPFILFSLAPLLTAALVFNRMLTFKIAVTTVFAVILSHIFNPFYAFQVSPHFISQLTIFVTASALTASLPYLINDSLKQKLEEEQVQLERQRLSREIHDGVAQTLHALCWQVQQVRHDLALGDRNDYDVEKLEKLAEKARQDILQALEILRSRENESDLRSILTDCLEDFKQDNNIDYSLNIENEVIDLESESKKELASICREALTNINKHAGAHSVQVNVKQENGLVRLSIVDDGRGFDAISYHRDGMENNGHHGLAVMKERAALVKGRLHILSLPHRGTEVQVEVPCSSRRVRPQ